ncbi:MAG TPA: dockerin type I repeat-containing protein, partial [Clostridia bacterium]
IWFNENKETNWTINSSDAALSAFVKAVAVNTPKGIVGDLSGDGKINSTDYSLLKRYILGQSTSTPDMSVWDLNNDGKLNSADLSLMKRYILNIITSFPR